MKRILLTLLSVLVLTCSVGAAMPSLAAAATKDEICQGVGSSGSETACDGSTSGVNNLLKISINLFSIVVGIVTVIMIMISGFKYITSGGDSGQVKSAKDTLVYAVIGIVIVVLAQSIVQFVVNKATSDPPKDKPPKTTYLLQLNKVES